mmetsp:Transcript_19628/g.42688  ORF Transcript_19628/g.42688 Transcript_19628/m.42688 type:complete len:204 (+) Transcript_19628:85-696(+)|eukprot:CAMPEP_0168169994 /NCGR_PEP_ID=MMETSP0139_2-20121125/3932_1 /TAXON_ID=44445 /ORGANISM="Pseudo-nitzschia australis, Strain 10249 10 AB" /LENGTH=203 /DNA_ID=CAMNT_0008087445 /DNA_START=72 /DNA_END=683 /DNA_ORIENTATION=-
MKLLRKSFGTANKVAFIGAQAFLTGSICRYLDSAAGFSSVRSTNHHFSTMANKDTNGQIPPSTTGARSRSSRLFAGMSGPQLMNIDKEQMEEIIEDYENGGREESGYVVMDVREENEVAGTGKVSPNTHTLPLSAIGSMEVFEMDEDDFERVCGFPKPTVDETLVFTCAAGIRSKNACAYAAQAGYTQLVNYKGGAYDWFTGN